MTTEQLEKKYDLKLGQLILDWDLTNFYSTRALYFTLGYYFWEKVSEDPELTIGFIELYKDFLIWRKLDYSKWGKDLDFAKRFIERIDWDKYGTYFLIYNNESTIREFKDYLNFETRLHWGNSLSKDFMREFKDNVDWDKLGYWKWKV